MRKARVRIVIINRVVYNVARKNSASSRAVSTEVYFDKKIKLH
jgi:hypothetical protein